MEELLRRPRAMRVLLALYQREPGPMNQRQFMEASLHNRQQAQALREHMRGQGWITVRELPGHGNAGVLEIRLTPLGRSVALHLAAIDALARGPRRGP